MKKIYILLFIPILLYVKVNAQVIVLQPDAANGMDTYVSSLYDSVNYGTGTYLTFGGSAFQNDTFNLYIKFDLTSVTPGTTVSTARIDIYENGQNGSMMGYQYGVYEVKGPWAEDTLYWYNQPLADTTVIFSFGGDYFQWSGGPGWRSIFLPDTLVQNWVDNPTDNNGIVIKVIGGFYGYPYLISSDWTNAEYRPRIVINSDGSKISGTVKDSISGTPLAGAILKAYDFTNTLLLATDTSDISGNYILDVLYPDTFNVVLNAISGYFPAAYDSITVAEGQNYILDPALIPNVHAVAGLQCGTWSLSNSPYYITGDVEVPDSCQLIIEPGVLVQYTGPYKLGVYGTLKAIGTEADSVIFTNYDTLPSHKGRGLRFYNSDSSVVEYCRIENMYSFDNIWGQLEYDRGGGIYSDNSDLVIRHNLIRRNYAQTGAGMWIINQDGSVSRIDRNKIEENTAEYYGCSLDGGGGIVIYADNYYESVYLNENLFIGNKFLDPNTANHEGGGALQVFGGRFRIMNNTFFNNSAFRGPAIYASDFNGKILNNIFWSNTGSIQNEQVAIGDDTFDPNFEASYNCVPDSQIIQWTSSVVADSVPGVNNIYVYPEFADTLAGHFWLAPNSPCIDTGSNHYLYSQYDYLDRCRVFDGDANGTGIVDIGAYEYNASGFSYLDLGPDYSVCYDTANIISADLFYDHYLWGNGDTTNFTQVVNTDTFYITVSNVQGCYASDSIAVTVNPLPVLNLPADTALCGSDFYITAPSGFSSYVWNDSIMGTETFYATSGGDYWVYVTNAFECSAYSDTMSLTFYPVPDIILPDTTLPLSNGSVLLDAGQGYAGYEWSNGDNTHSVVVFGNYLGLGTHSVYVTVTTQDGCTAVGEAIIHVYDDTGISDYNNSELSVCPNPASEFIMLNGIPSNEKTEVQIFDMIGKSIIEQVINISGKPVVIDISSLSPGVYSVRLQYRCDMKEARFIKQ